ncbi:MAG TPA: S8 family serine peptidase, partial [Fimbriimonadaceae bacterium]|nr:S8 family serine peptidase [Fimbriimonadaceae bacterium]
MNLKSLCAFGALAVIGLSFGQNWRRPTLAGPTGKKNGIVAGELLVKLRPTPGRTVPVSLAGLPSGSYLHNSLAHLGWTLWMIPNNVDPRKAAMSVRSDPRVASAEPVNKVYALIGDPNDDDYGVQETEDTNPDVVLDLSNVNPSFTRLWYLDETFARDAWDVYPGAYYTYLTKPANAPMIAIIDSGCDQFHPDFINAGGTSTNTAMGGQLNWALSSHFSFGMPDGGSWNDDNGHGTHVAGLALAAANNGGFLCNSDFGIPSANHGIVGTGYNAQGMILKVIAQDGSGTDTDAAAAIMYAADNGADIINLSLGTENYSQVFQDAVTYAWQKGCLVVAAGNENGNGGGDLGPIYPAACSGALAVTADGPNWQPATADYAGYGDYVSIAAPGGDLIQDPDYILIQFIYSTAMETEGGANSLYDLSNQGALFPPYDIDYAYLAGTSMATPQVSGAAALYYGYYGLHRAQGHVNIRAYRALERSAQSVEGAPNGAWEPVQGYGVLDAYDLLFDADSRSSTVGSIEGIVYSGGTPVPNVQVRAQATTGGTTYSTTTHGDGEYRFDSMPPATYNVKAAPFGVLKTKTIIVSIGSDATGVDFWVNGNPFQDGPPVVPLFTVNSVGTSS